MNIRHKFLFLYIVALFLTLAIPVANSYAQPQNVQTTDPIALLKAEVKSFESDLTFSQSIVGLCVINKDGKEIVSINPKKLLIPASNMKLITTGAALKHFSSDYRFTTTIAYDGEIIDGTLYGNIRIIGGGDPTLGSKDSIATPIDRTFSQWFKAIKEAGIEQIEGEIIGDGRWFDGQSEEQSWLWEDLGTYYGTGTSGLNFYENIMSFSVSPGSAPGEPVNICPYYPETPWMYYKYNCKTGKEGTGDQLYLFTSEFAPIAEIRGSFGIDKGIKRVDCSNKFPEYTCAYYFKEFLEKKGISCANGASDFKLSKFYTRLAEDNLIDSQDLLDTNLTILTQTYSPTLNRIAFETNHISNNVFAETLLRQMGKDILGSAEYAQSTDALKDILNKELGLNISNGIFIKDGSGLSRGNLVSPDFLCRFLRAMMLSENFDDFIYGLPKPGGNGTLFYNMKKYPDSIKNRIRMKSGSMNGVRCYSGYILPPSGKIDDSIIFSIMVNNCTSPTWKVRPLLDQIIVKLAELNLEYLR